MHVRTHFSSNGFFLFILSMLVLALVFSCGEQPTGIEGEPEEGGFSGTGDIDPGAGGSFLLGTVSDTTFAEGHLEVWAMDVAFDPATGIVSFDVQLQNCMRTDIHPPIHFVITRIMPRDIAVLEFDGTSADGFPYYDFSDKLGDDGILEAGGRTERVTMKFHTVEPRSFAIGFRIDLGTYAPGGMIAGVVFRDDNRDGIRERCEKLERCEPGIPGIVVALKKPLENVILLVRTDRNGEYRFGGLRAGVYEVFVEVSPQSWEVTSVNPLLVTLVAGPDGEVQDYLGANFGLFPLQPPPSENLFGPVIVGPFSPFGTLLDSLFVNPPSILPVVQYYYIDVVEPPFMFPSLGIVDTAAAWINDELVFAYRRPEPPDSAYFWPRTIRLREGLVRVGENTIRLFTDGNEEAALMWRVYKKM